MKKKVIALVMASVMLVVVTVGATVAWLTAESEEVTNTFVVGDIKILLNEADVNGNDADSEYNEFVYDNSLGMDYEAADRVQENTYKLMPGSTYFKDPKVTVLAGSERSYVFVKVTETNNPHEWHNGSAIIEWDVNDSYWLPVKDNEGNLVEGLYYYKDVVDVENYTDVKDFVKDKGSNSVVSDPYLNNVNGNGDRVLPSVIKDAKIKIRDTYDGVYKDDSDNYYNPEEEGITPELKFDAYAIQADNMEGSIYDIWTRLDKQLNPSAYDDSTSSN